MIENHSSDLHLSFHINNQKVRNQKYFVYKDKEYPIDFDLVIKNSNYFYKNRKQYENVEYINLINEIPTEIKIPEESIKAFISSCQNEASEVSPSSVFALQYLSQKYEFPEITKVTEDFIKEHEGELVFETLEFKTKSEYLSDTSKEEEIISNNIKKYANKEELLSLPIFVIERILQKYFDNKTKEGKEVNDGNDEIINFLFKILDKRGREASILFNNIDFGKEKVIVLHRLLNEYSDNFDFNMINSTLLKTTTQLTSDLSRQQEEYSILLNEMKKENENQREEIKRVKEECNNINKQSEAKMKFLEEKYEKEMESVKKENEERIKNIENQFERILHEYQERIKNSDNEKYSTIILETTGKESFEELGEESQKHIVKEIIINDKHASENNELHQNILLYNRIFDCVTEDENEIKSKNEEMRTKFIINSMKEHLVSFNVLEKLYLKGNLERIINCIYDKNFGITLEIKYPTKSFDDIMNIIFSIQNQHFNEIEKINIKTNVKIYDDKEEEEDNHNNRIICEIEKEMKSIDTNAFTLFIKSVFKRLTMNEKKQDNFYLNSCKHLSKIVIPTSITKIGCYAFCLCLSLRQVMIPSSVTTVESHAFDRCSSLVQIEIPSSVTEIKDYAFYGCSSLQTITIPSSVQSIGSDAFQNCSSLIQVTILSSLKSIESYTFNRCSSLTTITIPSSVSEIGGNAFSECSSLMQVTVPSSVKSIGSQAFYHCSSLTQITIPNSETKIGSNAFDGCPLLTNR